MEISSCFVIMAIGDQEFGGGKITYSDLRSKYDDLIKEALLFARPKIDVTRADDVAMPGTITTDIISRIMHSDLVIADVTFPNPNVFYELGLRHACRSGTIIIKDKNGPGVPFDIAHLRYVEYENTPSGLKALGAKLKEYIDFIEKNPGRPDNHLQEHAKLTHYEFPDYKETKALPPEIEMIKGIMESPELLNMFIKHETGEQIGQHEVMRAVLANPKVSAPLLQAMAQSGDFKLFDDGKKRKR